MKIKKTNPRILNLIKELYALSEQEQVKIWKDLAKRLQKPRYAKINLNKLSRITKKDEIILVPGKVLGSGTLEHSLNVFSLSASKSAIKEIEKVGSYALIEELMKKNPKGKNVRIIK